MATVKGQNLRIFMDNGNGQIEPIAAAQECVLNVRLNVKQINTKDDTDDFARHIALRLSWSVTAKGVVTTDPDRNDPSTLMDRVGQTVHVQLALASGTQNSEQGDVMLAGDAIIQDVQITAQNEEESTYQVSLTGKKNALIDISALMSAEHHYLYSSNGKRLCAEHEPTE
jgi:predicted secreted protein